MTPDSPNARALVAEGAPSDAVAVYEDVVRWAATEAAPAAELFAREGVLESWHAEEFDLGTGDDLEDFQRLTEAARDGIAPGGVLLPGQVVIVQTRLPWLAPWPPEELAGADLDRLFAGGADVDPAERQTPSIAVVDRRMAKDLMVDASSRYAVQAPPRLDGCAVVLTQTHFADEDVDTWLMAAPERDGWE